MLKRFMSLFLLLCLLPCAARMEETEVNTQLTHYLLLGQDGYAENIVEDARTDTIVIVTLDEKYNRVVMTSVLRDCKIPNPNGNDTKANLIYRYFGFEGVTECLERQLDIEIEGAVLVNFEHVKPVIDALGGVDIEITEAEYLAIRSILLGKDPNMPEGPGMTHMTGRIALAYMRTRATGSGGDFSRTERQRKVVSQLFDKCRELSLLELVGVYNQVSSGMKMDLSAMDILGALSKGYKLMTSGASFEEFSIPQSGTYSYGTVGSSSSALNLNWKKNREMFHELLNNP
ncbi:MAG: LCP family protein [Christensenellales bacterium]|nr:LCP family protein [Christensenellales bacterium]